MEDEVTNFEETILFYADAYNTHGPGSLVNSPISSGIATPNLTPGESGPSSLASSRVASRSNSFAANSAGARRPSFGTRLSNMLRMSSMPDPMSALPETESAVFEDAVMEDVHESIIENEAQITKHELKAWQVEATAVDRSVQILPGVKKMISSIPAGRYAVATSGAKTYGMFVLQSSASTILIYSSQLTVA